MPNTSVSIQSTKDQKDKITQKFDIFCNIEGRLYVTHFICSIIRVILAIYSTNSYINRIKTNKIGLILFGNLFAMVTISIKSNLPASLTLRYTSNKRWICLQI